MALDQTGSYPCQAAGAGSAAHMEQIIDTFVPVPMLDAPATLVVDVLKIINTMLPDVEQVIEVPKIIASSKPRCLLVIEGSKKSI